MADRTDSEDTILKEMHKGHAPSAIDKRMRLSDGEAHAAMVRLWKRDRNSPGKGVMVV